MSSPLDNIADLDQFRASLRKWIPDAIPDNWRERVKTEGEKGYLETQREWYHALSDAGLAAAHWPAAWGGCDLPLAHQIAYFEEMLAADAPMTDLYSISLYHMAATLFAHGTDTQRERYLEGARTGGAVWCQGFSEPSAGSDLASLRTLALRKGDSYVINGQKVWSSYGLWADYCLLLARTDPGAKRKHDGLSLFIVDMKTPGITVRPIRQISGDAEFCEIFFDDVEIPAGNLVGEENRGWSIAQSTLTTERGLLTYEYVERLVYSYDEDCKAGRDTWLRDPVKAQEFRAFYPRIRALRHLVAKLLDVLVHDPHGGNDLATYIKLYWGPLLQDYTGFMSRVYGLQGLIETKPLRGAGPTTGMHYYDFLWSFSWTIAGGSNEIMRNVISERLLGLPR
jgi:alkylation response protein AidB-like acyl-CoA dehydrogenase